MRTSPKTMALVYFAMGVLFTYFAIQAASETIWNFSTLVLALIATLDFGLCIRLVGIHFRIKNNKKKE